MVLFLFEDFIIKLKLFFIVGESCIFDFDDYKSIDFFLLYVNLRWG